MTSNDKQQGQQEGTKEAQQDRKQDEVAKQRPGQTDQAIHDAETGARSARIRETIDGVADGLERPVTRGC